MTKNQKEIDKIKYEIAYIAYCWSVYSEAFVNEENAKVLNLRNGGIFNLFRISMIRDILLGICKLTDTPSNGSNKNLTLDYLNKTGCENYASEIEAVKISVKNIRNRRRKFLAHLDYKENIIEKSIPDVTIEEIDSAVKSLIKLLNTMPNENTQHDYKERGNVARLIRTLKIAHEHDEHIKRLRAEKLLY